MENTFQAGDLVSLKSNPVQKMIIKELVDNLAYCIFFHPDTFEFVRSRYLLSELTIEQKPKEYGIGNYCDELET